MKTLYFIAGPNGAGKTTASFEILPQLWDCKEFVNADEIARGLSPFNPEEMALEAGKLQLQRIQYLLNNMESFAIETTLATRSYVNLVKIAHEKGYEVELVFFFLPNAEAAIERVKLRVMTGGHNIPSDVIRRRFEGGLHNLFNLYMPIVDRWQLIDNQKNPSIVVAEKKEGLCVYDALLFEKLRKKYEQS